MKVLYLFNGSRQGLIDKVKAGENHGDGFWGMLRLPHYGVEADYAELEQYFPIWLAKFLRRFVNIYFIHLPFFFKIFWYDIVFTSSAFGSQMVYSLFHFFGIRKPIWVMHDFSILGLLGAEKTLKQKIFRFMVMRAAGVVTLSNDETVRLEQRFPHLRGKVELIPFGVDANFFKPQEVAEENQILAAGFDPDRDWDTLIEACKDLNVKIVLATRPERVAKCQPLPANIKLKQFSLRDLVKEYSRSALIVVPLNTSFGTNDAMGCSTLFEGMAMAKPVVVTRTRATESYVKNMENGILVEERNVAAMKQAIQSLLADKDLRHRMGVKARQYAIEELDPERRAKQLADFFNRLLEARKGRS